MARLVSIAEAARDLEIDPSRVRALVASGELDGIKLGGRWAVDRASVARRQRIGHLGGRPYEPRNAWGVIFLASRLDAPWLSSVARWRLEQALAIHGLAGLQPRLTRRAALNRFHAHPGEVAYLFGRPEPVHSGISAAREHNLPLVPTHEVDAYVDADEVERICEEHALEPASAGEGNVVLRVVPSGAWPFGSGDRVAPLAAVALDLAEDPDPRSARIGAGALKRLDAEDRDV